MCGIAGVVGFGGDCSRYRDILGEMVDSISHRGPDHNGVLFSDLACFGHVRLAIIDPERGQQPVGSESESNSMWMVFSGEIYNYVELAKDLEKTGYKGPCSSDTEVLYEGFKRWGVSFVKKLRGMFAIALWDPIQRKLWLMRDALGVKPLYFTEKDGLVAFGSEPKALLASGIASRRVSLSGLQTLLSVWPYKTADQRVFSDIEEVPGGEVLEFSASGRKNWSYWNLAQEQKELNYEEAVAETHTILEEVMTMQARSDVGVAFALSGGVDSTTLAFFHAEQQISQPLRTFSMGFTRPQLAFSPSAFRPDQDEPYIEIAVAALDSEHRHFSYDEEEVWEAVGLSLRSRDLPDTGDLDSSLLLFFQDIAGRGVKVCISGEGADELFGGYPWPQKDFDKREEFPWSGLLGLWPGVFKDEVRRGLNISKFETELYGKIRAEATQFLDAFGDNQQDRLESYLNLKVFLGGQLDRVDRASMANGIEVRVPFCDHVLVQHVWQLDMKHKKGDKAKQLLRDAAPQGVPMEIRTRAKASYPTLGTKMYQRKLEKAVIEMLADRDWMMAEWLDHGNIINAIEGKVMPSARPNVWMSRLLALHRWVKEYDPDFSDVF